jgi:hypothetical protein
MSYAISVPTPFNDITELAESFSSRVDEERIMLPNDQEIPEGEWVRFEVTLADGTAALAGTGRCSGTYDNGEDRAPEHRFDIVMDQLELDEMAQVYFERVLMARGAAGEQPTGELVAPPPEEEDVGDDTVAVDELAAAVEEPEPEPEPEPLVPEYDASAPAEWEESAPTELGELGQVKKPPAAAPVAAAPVSARSAAPAAPPRLETPAGAIYELPPPTKPGELPTPHGNGTVLTRRHVDSSWAPIPAERPEPGASTGYFQYGQGVLPAPAQPPRPNLDPSLRVAPAPRPGQPGQLMQQAPSYGADETVQVGIGDDEDYS